MKVQIKSVMLPHVRKQYAETGTVQPVRSSTIDVCQSGSGGESDDEEGRPGAGGYESPTKLCRLGSEREGSRQ